MPHLVLLGDSIFDNAPYVPGEPAVVDQVRAALPPGWQATLLAVDGHVTVDVQRQMERLPGDATHLIVSAGGNDALAVSWKLYEKTGNVAQGIEVLHEIGRSFRRHYQAMLKSVLSVGKPTALCTIYDGIPVLSKAERSALTQFNDVITREAFASGLPLIDLRLVCDDTRDYSSLSPIEPSVRGGAKIAAVVARIATSHDFAAGRSVVYA